ncbi:hypothetical protein LEP1GSC111_1262 [Leptospira interrogans str. UT126]|nr:hypothetical protein LEP1GSC111_1262 [Leptospira interrogans str. UT126]EMO78597.1 hypothetical protein LEP1GSC126_0053 [Leptospira kirschneri str. 200801774]
MRLKIKNILLEFAKEIEKSRESVTTLVDKYTDKVIQILSEKNDQK